MTSGFDAFAARARQGGGMVPVTRQVVLDGDTPVTAFAKLHRGPYGFLLESLEGGERWARYTFLATDPREVFRYRGRRVRALDRARRAGAVVETRRRAARAPRPDCCAATRRSRCPGLPRFTGGAVGYLGYDVVRTIESPARRAARRPRAARRRVMVTDTLLVLDNLYNRATVIANVEVAARRGRRGAAAALRGGRGADRRWLERLAAPGTIRPLAIEPPPRCRPTGPYADDRFQDDVRADQGVHRRGRHLPDRAVAAGSRSPAPDPS